MLLILYLIKTNPSVYFRSLPTTKFILYKANISLWGYRISLSLECNLEYLALNDLLQG